MKKMKCLLILMLFTVFVPKVYAFTYDFDTEVNSTSVKKGSVNEITVSLKFVTGVVDGFGACSMNIELDSNLSLDRKVKALNGWTVMPGDIYSFDTSDSFVSDSEMFLIPVKVNANGRVKITNIMCSDGVTKESISDKVISFTVVESSDSDSEDEENVDTDKEEDNGKIDSNSTNLSSITLSEGTIDFDPSKTEYNIKVKDFSKLEVLVETESEDSSFFIHKNDTDGQKSVTIMVVSLDENKKTYTIYVTEENSDGADSNSVKNNYVPIFIGIIVLLVLINLFRIVKKGKK